MALGNKMTYVWPQLDQCQFSLHLCLLMISLCLMFAALRYYRQRLNVIADIEEMETELQEDDDDPKEEERYTMAKLLKTKDLHMPLLLAIMLQVIQQLSGINAVSNTLFNALPIMSFKVLSPLNSITHQI